MEWADLSRLIEQDFHYYTQALYELESDLATPIHDSLHWSRRFEYPWALLQLRSSDLSSILDAGSGATALQFFMARSNVPTTSIDIDQSAIDWVNSKTPKKLWAPVSGMLALTEGPKPQSTQMNLTRLIFPDNSFGTVICISVLEHLPMPEVMPAIRNMIRIAKTNVLITMDVCLNTAGQTDIPKFTGLMKALDVEVKPLPQTALTFEIHGQKFAVACLRFTK
jgi:2-polyprenyl-3-methyl-5-hydroxy-6-metoxy-1,4-benzoquinol methylase